MSEPKRAEPIEFHAEQWLDTVGGVNRVAICAAPVELPRNGALEEIKPRGFTIDGQAYILEGVGCHMPATPIRVGEMIELLVVGGPKRAEPAITINGFELTTAEAMTVRCAIESFAASLAENGLGEDEHGEAMTAAYLARINSIRRLIFGGKA